jgi:hypothetical protein
MSQSPGQLTASQIALMPDGDLAEAGCPASGASPGGRCPFMRHPAITGSRLI